MASLDPGDICFVGLGTSAQCYYRVMLPALELGADWCGLYGAPPKLRWATGLVRKESKMPTLGEYKVVVIQQPADPGWLELIDMLHERGVTVVYEQDDYVHGIKHMKDDHAYAERFGNEYLAKAEACMKACDGLIASTEWIAGNYSHFCKQTYVCRNGLDPDRYDLSHPDRQTVNIGWAGGVGHKTAVIPWFVETARVMTERPHTCFVSVGEDFALRFAAKFGDNRALWIPWAAIEQYPGAMTSFDIALAPGGEGGFFRGKSDLRWLEASALGIPTIANPAIYPEIEDAVTGFKCRTPGEVRQTLRMLVDDEGMRSLVGDQAKDFVLANRTMKQMAQGWMDALEDLVR